MAGMSELTPAAREIAERTGETIGRGLQVMADSLSELPGKAAAAIEAAPVPALTRDQAAALVAVVERIACHVTGSSRDDPGTAYLRLGFRPAEVSTLTSIRSADTRS
jgi:hypothetical protein